MAKVDLIRSNALLKCWTKRDLQRVYKKLKDWFKEYGTYSIDFNNAEELCMMLDENLDVRIQWSLIRLIEEDKIEFFKFDDGSYCISVLPF